jgi:hypothetical protein
LLTNRVEISGMIFGKMQRLEVVNGIQMYFSVSSPDTKPISRNPIILGLPSTLK